MPGIQRLAHAATILILPLLTLAGPRGTGPSTGKAAPARAPSHAMTSCVMSAAGSPGVGAGLRGVGSLGQPTPIGIGTADGKRLYAGFWGSVRRQVVTGAPPGPATDRLLQNIPNPFNPATVIECVVSAPGRVRLEIFGLRGERIRSLLDAELPAGRHRALWDGRDDDGRAVASGVYFYRLRAGEFGAIRKLTLVR